MEKIVLNFIITFFLNQLTAWEATINWTQLQATLDDHINRFFPIKAMDAGLIAFAAMVFKTVQAIISEQAQLAILVGYIENNNWKAAVQEFESMLVTAIPQLKGIL